MSEPVTVYVTPVTTWNPYQALVADALQRRGATAVTLRRPTFRFALRPRRRRAILHLHWLELIVGSNVRRRTADMRTALWSVHLLAVLLVVRARGIRIVWTVHNLVPHESRRPAVDRVLGRAVALLAHIVIAHSNHAASQAAPRIGRNDITVVPHGNYVGFYPDAARSRAETRKSFGIDESAHVFLAFGIARKYKRLPELAAAFSSNPDPSFRLLIAGRCQEAWIEATLRAAAAADSRILLLLDAVPDDRVKELHVAADVAVLAYRDVYSSGALLLALSCGLPVIAPAGSTATEIAPAPIVQPYPPTGLAEALRRSAPTSGERREQVLSTALRYGWDAMALAVLGDMASKRLGVQ